MSGGACEPVVVENSNGSRPFVIGCDHASNRIPDDCQQFFAGDALQMYIAWDPGALAVARRLSVKLDAPLIWPGDVSRLVIDCNRALDTACLIITENEGRRGGRQPGPEHRGPA